jgi:diguanylate cyclase (GGDEF)-like protein
MKARLMRTPTREALLAAVGAAAGVIALGGAWSGELDKVWVAILIGLAAVVAFFTQRRIDAHRARAEAAETEVAALQAELAAARSSKETLAFDLAQLGNYGNQLIDSIDLAEALQTSQQALSRMLPGCAGSVYPLIDGEGLSEATHLWGVHAAETRAQATWNDCRALGTNRLHQASSADPTQLCAHVVANGHAAPFSTACIPLLVQNDSLGWITLTAPGTEGVPKLPIAVAASEQLAQALANLKLRENLRDLSVRDPLTGLFNRRYLAESLGREMARSKRRGLPLTVMMMDLDHFKAFNDNYGHSAGDAVLVAFSRLLHNNFRSEDIACRLGGEEFVMIMPEMDRAVAQRRADAMLDATTAIQLVHEGRELPPITVSIGLAIFPEDGETPDEMMRLADEAVYKAKAQGRNCVRFATEAPAGAAPTA